MQPRRAFLLRRGAPAARELVLVFSVGLALEHPYFAVRRVPDLLELVDGPLEVGHAEDAHQKPVGYLGDLYAESGQTLKGSFSAVSKRNFASKYAFESARRDLHNALLCTALNSHFF